MRLIDSSFPFFSFFSGHCCSSADFLRLIRHLSLYLKRSLRMIVCFSFYSFSPRSFFWLVPLSQVVLLSLSFWFLRRSSRPRFVTISSWKLWRKSLKLLSLDPGTPGGSNPGLRIQILPIPQKLSRVYFDDFTSFLPSVIEYRCPQSIRLLRVVLTLLHSHSFEV
jgi:hypothetical protein